MKQSEIIQYCDTVLQIGEYNDYGPNGLQVEGDNRDVNRVAVGVSISKDLIEKAISREADLILVHHGLFWNKDERVIRGPMREKLDLLFRSNIALAAYHLPLDFHPELGNNVQLARQLGLTEIKGFSPIGPSHEGIIGTPDDTKIQSFVERLESVLGRQALSLLFGKPEISKVALITGGAQDYFLKAIDAGADCFVTGEASEKIFSLSKEWGVHFISAGHYHTEKFGIQALAKHLEEKLSIEWQFIDIPNPI